MIKLIMSFRHPIFLLCAHTNKTFHVERALRHRLLLAPRCCHLGGLVPPFWHPAGSFWHLGAPWETMGVKSGHEEVRNCIFMGFGLILRSCFESCLGTEARNFNFCSGSFPGHLLHRLSRSKFGRLGLLKAISLAKNTFSQTAEQDR